MAYLRWAVLLASLTISSSITICSKDNAFEYDMDMCPGGIQLRNENNWVGKSQGKLCICGTGPIIQFDGEAEPWHEWIYPPDFPKNLIPFLGSWSDYNLEDEKCEPLRESSNQPSLLFLSTRKFLNPDNFPTRAIELIVQENEHKRLPGSYAIELRRGLDTKSEVMQEDLLKTILLSSKEPVLIYPDLAAKPWDKYCAYGPQKPEVILGKYITTSWNITNIVGNCEDGSIPEYTRERETCKVSCLPRGINSTYEVKTSKSFQRFFELMAEISLKMKYADKRVPFSKENLPHIALLQLSSRLFHRGFPNVIKWESLLNAVTIFGIAFEGLLPSDMRGEKFDQIKLALGRCTLQQDKDQEKNKLLYTQICEAMPAPHGSHVFKRETNKTSNPKLAGKLAALAQSKDEPTSTKKPPISLRQSPIDPKLNKLIDLLWKMVQYAQMKCLSILQNHPNVHHMFIEAMTEIFATPAVQVLWYGGPEKLNKAMMYVLPELPDNSFQIIDLILEKTEYSVYFNSLQRPKIPHLEDRDMECAGHGKLIWGGKACCYFEEEDRKYRFYNRVAFAKL